MSIIKELKRRNVIKVAMAYIIAAWLLLQIADVAINNIGAPGWVFQTILLLVALGFPFSLIFAWAFELTPQGLKREHEVDRSESITQVTGRKFNFTITGLLAIMVVFLVVDNYVLVDESTPVAAEPTEPAMQAAKQSIAVLPFVNMSDDPGNEYFSDGLSEEILNLLAKIRDLKVIARTSSFAFKGKNEDIRIVGEALGAKTVLEGSVRKSGDRVRITAQLIDASDGSHLWSETYDRTITDIFAVQDDVAAAIIDALQLHVGTSLARGRPTESSEAYAFFLKARASLNAGATGDAFEFVLRAIELDETFAEAHELLAYCYWNLGDLASSAAESQKLMGEAAAKALAIDPDLVVAQVLYQAGNTETYSYMREIEALEWGVRQQPGNPMLLQTLSWDLLEAGYLQEALGVAERQVQVDPLSTSANLRLANVLYAVERTEEALAALDLVVQLGGGLAQWALGAVSLMENQDDIAVAHFEAYLEEFGTLDNYDWVAELVTGARDPATGQAHLDQGISQVVASALEEDKLAIQNSLNELYMYLGFPGRFLDTILDLDLDGSIWTDADIPVFYGTVFRRTGFTADPKYIEIAEAIGMMDVWEQRGPPDFCRKVAGEWVCE
jgi:adenylate cyclase